MYYKYLSSLLFKYQAALTRIQWGWYLCKHFSRDSQAGENWRYGEKRRYDENWRYGEKCTSLRCGSCRADDRAVTAHRTPSAYLCFPPLGEGSWLWQPQLSPSFPRLLGDSVAERALNLLHHLATFWYVFLSVNRIVHPLCCCRAPNTSLCCGDRPCCSSRDASCPTAASLHFHLHLRHHLGFQEPPEAKENPGLWTHAQFLHFQPGINCS